MRKNRLIVNAFGFFLNKSASERYVFSHIILSMLSKELREFTELKELTPEIVNTLIQRIEVHNSDRSTGKISSLFHTGLKWTMNLLYILTIIILR